MAHPFEALRRIQMEGYRTWTVPDFPRIEKVVRFIQRWRPRPGKALDLGYATGSFGDSLKALGWECLGLDLCPRPGSKIQFIAADVSQPLPFQSESFHLVTAGEIIEHVLDERALLEECHRVLVPGGLLVVTTPNLTYSLNRFLVPLGRLPLFVTAPYHFHFHNRRSLVDLLTASGFGVLKVSASHLLYSRRRHWTGWVFERLANQFPTWGAHLITYAIKPGAGKSAW